jgi:HSP20 family molecular chaperone IbpA
MGLPHYLTKEFMKHNGIIGSSNVSFPYNSEIWDQLIGPSNIKYTMYVDEYDIQDTIECMTINMRVVGMTNKDVKVEIVDRMIQISAVPPTPTKLVKVMSLSWPLPNNADADKATAVVENGILTVKLPKTIPVKKTTTIAVL